MFIIEFFFFLYTKIKFWNIIVNVFINVLQLNEWDRNLVQYY